MHCGLNSNSRPTYDFYVLVGFDEVVERGGEEVAVHVEVELGLVELCSEVVGLRGRVLF